MEMTKGEGMTPEEYIAKLEKERDNCLKEIKLCYNDIHGLEGQISDLEKENKNLKLIQETNEKQIQNDIKERDELREEIKKLKAELELKNLALKQAQEGSILI